MLDEFNKVFKTQNEIMQIQRAHIGILKEQLTNLRMKIKSLQEENEQLNKIIYEFAVNGN